MPIFENNKIYKSFDNYLISICEAFSLTETEYGTNEEMNNSEFKENDSNPDIIL
jgi:hypothetical protein